MRKAIAALILVLGAALFGYLAGRAGREEAVSAAVKASVKKCDEFYAGLAQNERASAFGQGYALARTRCPGPMPALPDLK